MTFSMGGLKLVAGAEAGQISSAEQKLGLTFPQSYRDFLMQSDGAAGWLTPRLYVELWSVERVATENLDEPERPTGIVLIGTDGAEMYLALRLHDCQCEFGLLPMLPLDTRHWVSIGTEFESFLACLDGAYYR